MMEKRGVLIVLGLFLMRLVSAQFFGGYGRFSLTDLFYNTDPSTIVLGLLFLIFFALLFYTLSRVFKDQQGYPNKAVAGTIAFAISFLIIYGIHRSGFDFESLFYGGIPSGILTIIILALAVLVIWALGRTRDRRGRKIFSLRRGLGGFFMLSGLLLVLLSIFTEIFYEETTIFVVGIILFAVGLLLLVIKRLRTF